MLCNIKFCTMRDSTLKFLRLSQLLGFKFIVTKSENFPEKRCAPKTSLQKPTANQAVIIKPLKGHARKKN